MVVGWRETVSRFEVRQVKGAFQEREGRRVNMQENPHVVCFDLLLGAAPMKTCFFRE